MELKPQLDNNPESSNFLFYLFFSLCVPSMLLLILYLNQLRAGKALLGDTMIVRIAEGMTNPFSKFVFTLFTEMVTTEGIIALLILSIILIWWKSRDYVAIIVLALGTYLSDELNKWLKEVFARERPHIDPGIYAEGYSFPSGHAMIGLMFYGFLTYFLLTKLRTSKSKLIFGIIMSLFIFLIGFSRIILNAHYPSDVIGGFAIGFIGLVIMVLLHKGGTKVWPIKK